MKGFAWEFSKKIDVLSDYDSITFLETVKSLPNKPEFSPWAVQIEPTNYCNISCDYCPSREKKTTVKHLNFSRFKKIIASIPSIRRIHLQGLGEPMLCPELFSMIKYAKRCGIYVSTITNGTVLNQNILCQLAGTGLDELSVSIDVPKANNAYKLRNVENPRKLWENLNKIKSSCPHTLLKISCVITSSNLGLLPELIRDCRDVGIRQIFMQEVQAGFQPTKSELIPPSVSNLTLAKTWYGRAYRTARDLDMEISIAIASSHRLRRYCLWPWTSVYIKVNGDVTPCCINLNAVGNIFRQPWNHIWSSVALSEFREHLKNGPLPCPCEGCNYL